jgi:malate dehydrogenase (oxaloacetate-decarboxylating)
VVGKELSEVRIVQSGAGAAGTAVLKLLMKAGATDIVVADRRGAIHSAREDIARNGHENLIWLAENTNKAGVQGTLKEVIAGADVFIGVSAPNLLTGDDIATMNHDSIVFALANPDPEVNIAEASQHAAVVASGRSDTSNQINNVLAFPGVFRGLLDAQSHEVTDEVLFAAANALANIIGEEELNAAYIIPSVFHPDVVKVVAAAVAAAAKAGTTASTP